MHAYTVFTDPVSYTALKSKDACMQKLIYTSNYTALGAEDKAALLEQGICPSYGLRGCDELLFMNFAADWDLLKPALEVVFTYTLDEHRAGGFSTILDESSSRID